jgi:DNA processing protein
MNDLEYYLSFSYFLGIGPYRFKQLKDKYQTVAQAYSAPMNEIAEVIGHQLALKFQIHRNIFNFGKELENLRRKNITVLTLANPLYPQQLLHISDPPICLYIKGEIQNLDVSLNKCFSVVGTREPTEYGRHMTKLFIKELSERGLIIVSGMAKGIDGIAHRAALGANGQTIAVLGNSVDTVYPAENRDIYNAILQGRGVIISEFPPDSRVLKGQFIARNRIISGFSKAIMVIEGKKDSGALSTGRYGIEQGRDVYALPGLVTSLFSEAPHILIKEGAYIVTSLNDILQGYGLKIPRKKKKINLENFSIEEQSIISVLEMKSNSIDEICLKLSKPVYNVLPLLTSLEVAGIIEKNRERKYELK